MIDDDVEVRIAFEHREKRRKLRGLDERVETDAERRQACKRGLHLRPQNPFDVGKILQHRPNRFSKQ